MLHDLIQYLKDTYSEAYLREYAMKLELPNVKFMSFSQLLYNIADILSQYGYTVENLKHIHQFYDGNSGMIYPARSATDVRPAYTTGGLSIFGGSASQFGGGYDGQSPTSIDSRRDDLLYGRSASSWGGNGNKRERLERQEAQYPLKNRSSGCGCNMKK